MVTHDEAIGATANRIIRLRDGRIEGEHVGQAVAVNRA
jgi:predicted ABC-type transport system involved in lysophospholipase L1 biosynthesis ATPase subunit